MFDAAQVAVALLTLTAAVGFALWALVQFVVSLIPVRVRSGNISITRRRRAPRTAWLHPRLPATLFGGALIANIVDLMNRRASFVPIPAPIVVVLIELGVVAVWAGSGTLLARRMTWPRLPEPSAIHFGGGGSIAELYRTRDQKAAQTYREDRERIAQVVRSLPVDRFRLDPLKLLRADKNALDVRGAAGIVRATWIATALDDGVLTRKTVPWKRLAAEDIQLLEDLEHVRSLPVPEWAALESDARSHPDEHPYTSALEIERVLGTRRYLLNGRPTDGSRTPFYMRFGPYTRVFLAPWSMVTTEDPPHFLTLDQVRGVLTADGDDRPDEIGNARAIALIELLGLPGKYKTTPRSHTTSVARRAMELCNGVDQIALAACWLDPVIESGRMTRADLAALDVSEAVLEVLDVRAALRERRLTLRDLGGDPADPHGISPSLKRLELLQPAEALAARAKIVGEAEANVEGSEGRAWYS